jgi:MFS family permease
MRTVFKTRAAGAIFRLPVQKGNGPCHPRRVAIAARTRLRASSDAFAAVFRNPQLRRLELAWSGSILGQWGYEVALAVFAYRTGGAAAVGIVTLIRLLPAALVAPFSALLGDRYRRDRVMVAADLVRAGAMAGAAAAALAHAPAEVVYSLACLVSIAGTAFQPAQSALLPALAGSPEELTAANATSTTLESVGFFVGPALGGLLLAATGVGAVFAATAATFGLSAVFISGLRGGAATAAVAPGPETSILREALAGFRAIATDGRMRTVVTLYGSQTLAAGVLRVLIVVSALELLDLGTAGVGFLNSAVGVGAITGLLVVLSLLGGGGGLATMLGAGIVLWGIPLALLAAWPVVGAALALFVVLGAANTLVDVAASTLLQRVAPDDVRARVFGVLESMLLATIGLGAVVAPAVLSVLGIRWALAATGLLLVVVGLLARRPLARVDTGLPSVARELALLRSIPMFAPLAPTTLEQLAASLVTVRVPAGSDVFRRGDPGDNFYVIAGGEAEVAAEPGPVRLGSGDFFGEIALLRDTPRTATVTALTGLELYALHRDVFVGSVTGHSRSAEAANAVVASRLGAATPTFTSP